MRLRSHLWTFLCPELAYKKNVRFGFAAIVVLGILMVLWSFMEPIASLWIPALEQVPFIRTMPAPLLVVTSLAIWFLAVFYILGFIVRIPSLVVAYVGREDTSALRFAYWLKHEPKWRLLGMGKRIFRSGVRFFVRSSSLTTTLDRLFVVTVPYLGGTFDAWVTKVQRVWDQDLCSDDTSDAFEATACSDDKFIGYRLWVFLVDWPIMAMGKPLRYWMADCRVPAISAKDAVSQVATLGISAATDVHERKLTTSDVESVISTIEDSEPALVVAGVIEPEFAESLWIESGRLNKNWREN